MPSKPGTSVDTRRPGRPRLIDRDRIVAATLNIAELDGVEAVTMARVARELGVAAPALYHHVRNRDELLSCVTQALLAEMRVPSARMRWDRWLQAFAHELRDVLRTQPLLTAVRFLSTRPPFRPHVIERALQVLIRDGFPPPNALFIFSEHVRLVIDAVHAEHLRAEERARGLHQLEFLRDLVADEAAGEIPILRSIVEHLTDAPYQPRHVDDNVFSWLLQQEIAGLAALLEGRLSFRSL